MCVGGSVIQVAVLVADGDDECLQLGRQLVLPAQIVVLWLAEGADAHLIAAQEQHAGVVRVRHILHRLEQGELVVARLGGVGAELGAVAALVAHLVHMDDLMAAIGHADSHIGTVGAGVHTVLAHGSALEATLALPADASAHGQNALLGLGVGLGDVSLLRDVVGVGLADDRLGKGGGVGDALHHGGGAALGVTGGVHALHVGLEGGTALLIQLDAVGGHQGVVHLLAHGGDHQIAGDVEEHTAAHGTAAAGGVRLAQHHLLTLQHAVGLLNRSGQLGKFHTVRQRQRQLMLVGGHILAGTAVHQRHMLGAAALGKARRVHGGVAAADDGDIPGHANVAGLHALHPLDGACHIAGDIQLAGLPRAHGQQDVGIAHLLQLVHGGGGRAALHLHAVLLHQGDVLLDGLVGDAEAGDHMARHAAQAALPLENGRLDTGAAAEVGGCDTGGAAADNGDPLTLHPGGALDGGHQGVVALLRRQQLGITDADGLVIEAAAALGLAAVGADGAGDERQGVFLGDELQRRTVQALIAQLHILWDILCDGAAALAGCGEAVDPRHLLLALAAGQGLDGLDVMDVGMAGGAHLTDGLGVRAGEGSVRHGLHLLHHLVQAVVAAGLEDGGGHGDGPDARREQLVAVEILRAAGEGDAHSALELAGDAVAHLDGQGEQAAAGHIHLVVGQLAPGGVHGEGVGELQAELQILAVRQRLQPLKHGYGIDPLEILVEVVLVEHDVVVAHAVQCAPRRLVAQNGRVALDEGMQVLFGDEVAGDALDLIRGTAVEGGHGDAAADAGINGVDIVALRREQLLQHGLALAEDGGLIGVHHTVDIGVDLLALDALQIIAHGHIEHEAVRIAEAVDLAEHLQGAPRLDILVHGLWHGKLGGPLLVVALVVGQDTGTGDAGGQIRAVHLLDGLDLEEPGAGHVGGDDVLGQLAVGAGGGAEGRLDALAEDGQALARGVVRLAHTEDLAGGGVFLHHPVHQGLERNGIHFLRHGMSSLW